MVAHFLIDGVAGAAIIVIAFSLRRYLMVTGGGNLQPVMFWAGIGPGLASFAQAITGETLSYRAANGASADSVQTLFKVLNNGDTMKIAFLAIMIGAASILARRGGAFRHWLATSGIVFAPILALSDLAFPLYASLELTRLLLLTWVISVAVVVARRAPRAEAVSVATALS
jgi:hypothetical protein